ncbi:pectinesterase 3-like [Cornus florida]|uniref:pectinesterase 3-like n=1 Tax=Cornus florida TaxID=4283 RepID=UPI002899B8A7|nr:pectinesterase 3-like [Cornus florida]
MDSVAFKSYIKANELEEQAFRIKTRKRLIIITLSTIVLITLIIVATIGTITRSSKSSSDSQSNSASPTNDDVAKSIESMCNVTHYPDACFSSMSSDLKISSTNQTSHMISTDPQKLFMLSLQIALNELVNLSSSLPEILTPSNVHHDDDPVLLQHAWRDCQHLIEAAIDHVNMSIMSMKSFTTTSIIDIRTWLSTAITDQGSCLDGLEEVGPLTMRLQEDVRIAMKNSTEFTSNCLAIISNILTIFPDFQVPVSRKLLKAEVGGDYPNWVSGGKYRRLLLEEEEAVMEPNVTVAKDGSGDFRSIMEAVNGVPRKSEFMYLIYVKEGVYVENVVVGKDMWNVMVYGDGMNRTIVSGSLNHVDGVPTFNTGTFIAEGRGFIAKGMGFMNTAGPQKEQAVALRSSSDKSVFYKCSFNAFQDTLYAHSNRQFYRDCYITGTVDFIFGNAAVVIQNCTVQPRQPRPNQFNTITAQGKTDSNQNTGISIQRCKITPFNNLTAPTYLGRPWKNFSTAIFMQSNIGGFISPAGWIQWTPNVDPPKTIFYAEYLNTGPGSGLDQRVDWAGYKPNITFKEAAKFTVESFIQGSEWLPRATVTYNTT